MSTEKEHQSDFESVFDLLLQKTKESKLAWRETASESTFIAAVKGQRTFEISAKGRELGKAPILTVRDDRGKVVFRSSARSRAGWQLFEHARRAAAGADAKLEETLELLKDL